MASRDPRIPRHSRGAHTPRRERPGQAPQHNSSQAPSLESAFEFPELPKQSTQWQLPRGRKDRRSGGAWECNECEQSNRTRSFSRPRCDGEAPQGRPRAVSCDTGTEGIKSSDKVAQPSIMKKPRNITVDQGEAVNEAMAKLQKEMEDKMKEMAALMRKSSGADAETQMAMQLTQMLASLPVGDSLVENRGSPPAIQPCAEEASEEQPRGGAMMCHAPALRPRSLSHSWEFPLSKEEKKTRVVMMGETEICMQDKIIGDLQSEVERLSMDSQA